MTTEDQGQVLLFGEFKLDLRRRELRRRGRLVRIQDQPFLILVILATHPDELITREQVRARLWPEGTHVEFEKSINTAVMKLRDALRDPVRTPRFVQTVPRYGYRFIAPVEAVGASDPDSLRELPGRYADRQAVPPDPVVGPRRAGVPSPSTPDAGSWTRRDRVVSTAPEPRPPPRPLSRRSVLVIAAAGMISLVAVGALVAKAVRPLRPPASPSARFFVYPSEGTRMAGSIALSPDGEMLAFVATDMDDGTSSLWLRPIAELEARRLPGTEGAVLPFWSPDSQLIGFFADGKLKRTDVAVPTVTVLADAPRGRGGTWGRRGTILFSPDVAAPILEVSDLGGSVRAVSELGADPSHRYPGLLPDGRHFLYLVLREDRERSELRCGDLLDPERSVRVMVGASSAVYAPSGHLLLVRGSTLVAHRLDTESCQVSGPPVRVADGVGRFGEAGPNGYAVFTVSQSGVLAYEDLAEPVFQLVWLDRSGSEVAAIGAPATLTDFALSPDERQVAMIRTDPGLRTSDLWLLDLESTSLVRLTDDPRPDSELAWSPDGSRLAYLSPRERQWTTFIMDLDGRRATPTGEPCRSIGSWSPDGGSIVLEVDSPETAVDIWLQRAAPGGARLPLIVRPGDQRHPRVSPDGSRIAFTSNESGVTDVYVATMQGVVDPIRVSDGGGDVPEWRADGRELFFVSGGQRMMSVMISDDSGVPPSAASLLFTRPIFRTDSLADHAPGYEVAADGTRFLVAQPRREGAAPVTVVLD